MTDWQNVIDLSSEWRNGDISKLCSLIHRKLSIIDVPGDYALLQEDILSQCQELMDDIEYSSVYPEEIINYFNEIMEDLYDLGDVAIGDPFDNIIKKKLIWIKTYF